MPPRRTTALLLGLSLATASALLVLAACETPPSKYVPPPEPREVPNLDPPPGIPIMPSGSAAGKKPAASNTTVVLLPPPVDGGAAPSGSGATCKSDRDCVVTTKIGCCDYANARALLRSDIEKMEASCKQMGECTDVAPKTGDDAKNFTAKCVNKECSLVPKKKKAK